METTELTLGMADLRLKAGESDLQAFDELMRLHEKQVLGTALRLLGNMEDAQDAAQESFLRLFKNLHKLPDISEIKSWLYRVTVNVCNDAHRKRRRDRTEPLSGPDPESVGPDPESASLHQERGRLMEMALTTLSPKERAAVVLRDVEGLSTREVAGILGTSEVTVRSQICEARGKMKKFTDRYLRKRL